MGEPITVQIVTLTEVPRPLEEEAPDGYMRFWSGTPGAQAPNDSQILEVRSRLPDVSWKYGDEDLSRVVEDLMERMARKAERVLMARADSIPSELDPDERPPGQ